MAVVAELKGSKDLEFIGEYKSTMRAPLGIALFKKTCPPLAGVPDRAEVDSTRKAET
jgi:hypothetical protein